MLDIAETHRRKIHAATPRAHKAALGQFMTPASTAHFMASLFPAPAGRTVLLDAGAGLGALTCAVLDTWGGRADRVVAYEVDNRLRQHLVDTLAGYRAKIEVLDHDFLAAATRLIQAGAAPFTHAILNPPYKKIATTSNERAAASAAGLETVNLYSAFVGLALALLQPAGQLVAIIPRSFTNGPYYKPFRQWILARGAIRHLHLFESRDSAFRDDDVLQENLILRIERDGIPGAVEVSHSTDDTYSDMTRHAVEYTAIFRPGDTEHFLHIPNGVEDPLIHPNVTHTLADLGVSVSTGPVVDFRLRDHLRTQPGAGDLQLLYPHHLSGTGLAWPAVGSKKANAIADNADTARWLFPAGTYVLTRRFSSKEEKRRVVACLLPAAALRTDRVGFENHLNVFHIKKGGLPDELAWGMYVWLNSSALDTHLRRFSGHTQVNAADFRNMRFPSRYTLATLGRKARDLVLDQAKIDELVNEVLE